MNTRTMCSWCHTTNDVIPFAKAFCVECGHNFMLPRMECDCRVCRLRLRAATLLRNHELELKAPVLFNIAWALLEESGGCDAKGGLEYRRVRDTFERIGLLGIMEWFIHTLANAPAKKEGEDEQIRRMRDELENRTTRFNTTEEKPT